MTGSCFTKGKELEAINRFKQRARRAKEKSHKKYQSMMNKVGASIQRRTIEDTFARAEQTYLKQVQVAVGAETLSRSQALDLPESKVTTNSIFRVSKFQNNIF
ncbi:hypothetical protein Mapa_000775 [Marchantia paleacea]|nr:hypothetical protein Mapa_000775 [Marchantia paleacea]